jgi:hypothetical protein
MNILMAVFTAKELPFTNHKDTASWPLKQGDNETMWLEAKLVCKTCAIVNTRDISIFWDFVVSKICTQCTDDVQILRAFPQEVDCATEIFLLYSWTLEI